MRVLNSIFAMKKPTSFTPKQKELVQTTFKQLEPIAEHAAQFFYNKLFELDPSLKTLFNSNIKDQGRKLVSMLNTAVKGLDNHTYLIQVLHSLGRKHMHYRVQEEHYDTVATALLHTLETGLGESWTEEVEDAWLAIYTLLATTMKDATKAA